MIKYKKRGGDLGKDSEEISPQKNSNQCRFSDCQESKKKYDDYCTNHDWECSADNCKNRLHWELFNSYCSEHKYSCQTEYCKQRVNSSYSYCSEHERKYFCQYCRIRIGRGESYCSQHKNWKYCPVRNKVCRINKEITLIKDWSDYNSFRIFPSYDEEKNCQYKAFNGEVYCRQHQNECLEYSCSRRLDKRNKYCYDHAPACPTICQSGSVCISKVTTGDTYCSSHSKICLVCSYRVSADRDYCYDHERVCSDCSSRIAYNKYICGSCENQKNEQERLKSLVKQRTSLSNPQEVVKFGTWFNPNCVTVINKESSFKVFLIIYEPSQRSMPEIPSQLFPKNHSASQWGNEMRRDSHSYLSDAQNEAQKLRDKLKNHPNPILVVFSSLTLRFDENYSFEKVGGKKYDLPSDAINNPDYYIKPLDIVKIRKKVFIYPFEHVGVYLGNRKVAHIWDPSDTKSTSGNLARINSWNDFLKNRTDLPTRYHSILPFKKFNKIIEQIARTVIEKYGEGKYSVLHNNCEHYSYMVIYGIDFSPQAKARLDFMEEMAEREKERGPYDPYASSPFYENSSYNWRDSSTFFNSFNLEKEISKVEQKFNNLAKNKTLEINNKVREIKNHDENRWEKLIEVPSKDNCKIM